MVNKAVVGVIGVILITTLGVGALVGLQGGGGPADDASPNTNGNGNGQGPGTDTNSTSANETVSNGTATPVADEERTPIPGRQFTEQDIATNLTERINAWRVAEGMDRLETDGTTPDRLREMAMGHSVAMANEGELTHAIGNLTSSDRYRENDLYDTCMYKPPHKDTVWAPDNPYENKFEAIAGSVAGGTYEVGNETRFNEDETAVAGALLEQYQSSNASSDVILARGLERIGVGVEVTRDGAVYSTVNVCG
jgi:hypothetical protein